MSYELLRVNLLVSGKNTRGESVFHVDTFDLYSARQRTVFLKQASEELGVKEDVIRRDLGHVLLQLEALQDQQIKQALEPEEKEIPIGEEERAAAMTTAARSALAGPHPLRPRTLRHGRRGDEQAGELSGGDLAVCSMRRSRSWCRPAPQRANRP